MATGDVIRPHSLPPYPEMIMAALDALNEEMGSNKTSISKYIESKYQNLPAGHSTLLRHHLNRMKDTGELIFWKNNYMKPNPNFIRRGRGRPPKPKEPGSGVPTSSPTRPRGRPRKDEYGPGDAPAPADIFPVKKKKASPPENGGGNADGGSSLMPMATKTGRPRGRPPKAKAQTAMEGGLN